jgi:hypothetical protein
MRLAWRCARRSHVCLEWWSRRPVAGSGSLCLLSRPFAAAVGFVHGGRCHVYRCLGACSLAGLCSVGCVVWGFVGCCRVFFFSFQIIHGLVDRVMKLMDIRPVVELEEDAGWEPLQSALPVPRYRLEVGAGECTRHPALTSVVDRAALDFVTAQPIVASAVHRAVLLRGPWLRRVPGCTRDRGWCVVRCALCVVRCALVLVGP